MKKSSIAVFSIIIAAFGIMGLMIFLALHNPSGTDSSSVTYNYEVLTADAATVSRLSWTAGSASGTLYRSGEKWIWSDDPEMPVDPKAVEKLITDISSVRTSKRYTNVTAETRSGFGLTDPSFTVTVTDSVYGVRMLQIGKYSAAAGGVYVSLASEPETVFIVDDAIISAFSFTPDHFILVEQVPVLSAKMLDSFTLTVGEDRYRFQYEINGILTEKGIIYWYVSVNGAPNQPLRIDADMLCGMIIGMDFEKLVSWHKAELADYGITENSPTLTVCYTKTVSVPDEGGSSSKVSDSYTLRFGDTDDEGYDYVSFEGTDQVYLLSCAAILADLVAIAESCR